MSFGLELQQRWSLWVLAHGLPDLPGPDLAVGQSVPVSYWIGPTTAAVLHIRRYLDEEDHQEVITETDIDLFCLVDSAWDGAGGGGGGWAESSPLAPLETPADYVNLGGMNGSAGPGRGCKALHGEVGSAAAYAEVTQDDQTTRRSVRAPIGAFVVSAEYAEPFTVRVFNSRGELLAEVEEPGGFEEM